MQTLFAPHFTWSNLFATALLLAMVFLVLTIADRLLAKAILPERILKPAQTGLRWVLLFFEPGAALLLLVIFVFIRPELHGPVVALLLIGGFTHLRNYLSGFILRMYENAKVGKRFRTLDVEGVVTDIGRLGLQLRTHDGMHFASYSKLLSGGYTIVTGEESGGFFNLDISPKENGNGNSKTPYLNRLQDLFAHAPFLSTHHKPDIVKDLDSEKHFSAKILVEEEHHLYELISLLDERGWEVHIV